jgi:hypothetical protein
MRSPFQRRKFDSPARVHAGIFSPAGLGALPFPVYRLPSTVYRGLSGLSPLGSAIATAEGANPVTNNPGNLEMGDIGYGTWQAAGGQQITIYPTLVAGQAALENQINLIATGRSTAGYNPSMSIAQVGALYSGSPNGNWANNVANALGVTTDTNFASLAGSAGLSAAPSAPVLATDGTSSDLSDLTDLLGGSDTGSISPWVYAGIAAGVLGLAYAFS